MNKVPVNVDIIAVPDEDPIDAKARDFSILGAGLWVHHRYIEKFTMGQKITLEFQIPKSERKNIIGAVIRHIGGEGIQRAVGLEFINDSRFDSDCRRLLRDYVMRRQLEMRRKGVRNNQS